MVVVLITFAEMICALHVFKFGAGFGIIDVLFNTFAEMICAYDVFRTRQTANSSAVSADSSFCPWGILK